MELRAEILITNYHYHARDFYSSLEFAPLKPNLIERRELPE